MHATIWILVPIETKYAMYGNRRTRARRAFLQLDLLEALRAPADLLEAHIDGTNKLGAQSERSQFVRSYHSAASSMSASAAGRTIKRGASLATVQALVETGPNYLPGFSGIGILLEVFQAPIEFCPLSVGEGDVG